MDNLLPTANPIIQTPFEFIRPKFDYPGEIAPMPFFHNLFKPPKNILNFDCCDINFFSKEPTCFKTLHELHANSPLIYQRFITQTAKTQNFASPQYHGTQLFTKGPIHFNSNFECGNLYTVYKVADKKYNLILHNDTQTNGCTRWYFFSVRTPERMMLQLNIVNLSKQASQLSVNPYIYTSRTGWYRGGENVSYYKNQYQKKSDYYYTLSFSYLFEKDETIYFAPFPPYGITNLQSFLKPLTNQTHLKLKALSFNSGNQYPILTIGDSSKPLIIIIARQHPSQVVTSYVAEGIISFLMSDQSKQLRDNFYFKILPMMNPDGVIHGNTKTNLQGIDINQKWNKVNKQVPSAQHVKAILKKTNHLFLALDLHQTYKKYGISFVGRYDDNPQFITAFSQICKYTNLEQSKFGKSNKMEKTLPFALGELLNVNCIYQVRISDQAENLKDFTITNLKQIGENLCQAILLISNKQLQPLQLNQCLDISASESCESCDETQHIKKKLNKKKMITTNLGNENNISIATTSITKKSILPTKLKPLKPLCDLSQLNQSSNKKSVQQSQFKTRIRSFSTRTPEFHIKH
ncbi:unnamed protein product [Paramecium sonneborni]|uniref:Peptidase M14 domain-containing protein n=1 Tax=Paramecium sonneborni TaxID=65129 RepID=A0A8S1KA79_9CILI|nr:unnamed protein product [Paramecium sonneborni]